MNSTILGIWIFTGLVQISIVIFLLLEGNGNKVKMSETTTKNRSQTIPANEQVNVTWLSSSGVKLDTHGVFDKENLEVIIPISGIYHVGRVDHFERGNVIKLNKDTKSLLLYRETPNE